LIYSLEERKKERGKANKQEKRREEKRKETKTSRKGEELSFGFVFGWFFVLVTIRGGWARPS